MNWTYKGKEITSEKLKPFSGFVYLMTDKETRKDVYRKEIHKKY